MVVKTDHVYISLKQFYLCGYSLSSPNPSLGKRVSVINEWASIAIYLYAIEDLLVCSQDLN